MEDDPPYIYIPLIGNSSSDFDILFKNIPDVNIGSFNEDFNADFDIT